MEPTDLTIEILKDIRTAVRATNDAVRATNERIDATNVRLDATNTRLDASRDELSHRIDGLSQRVVESEIRVSTAITDLHGTVRDLVDELRSQRNLGPRVDQCERDISEIRHRLNLG